MGDLNVTAGISELEPPEEFAEQTQMLACMLLDENGVDPEMID